MSQRHYEKKYHTTEELESLTHAMGCRLQFKRMQSVFTIHDDKTGEWTWVINPSSNQRVKRVRELSRSEWITALSNAKKALAGDELSKEEGK